MMLIAKIGEKLGPIRRPAAGRSGDSYILNCRDRKACLRGTGRLAEEPPGFHRKALREPNYHLEGMTRRIDPQKN